ncbi:MAG: GNAT family N-acetyltransferase [Hyphomicrobiaceae bacterium]
MLKRPDTVQHALPALGLTLELHDRPDAIESEWRQLEGDGTASLYQSFAWLDVWCRAAAALAGERPVIVLLREPCGAPALILPLALTTWHSTAVLSWLGQSNAAYNMGLYRHDIRSALTPAMLRALLVEIGRRVPEAAAVHLLAQPLSWDGIENAMAQVAAVPSASVAYELELGRDFDAWLRQVMPKSGRRNLLRLERRLAEQGAVAMRLAQGLDERRRVLDVFLSQKAVQLEAAGLDNVFATPAVAAFLDAAFADPELGALLQPAMLEVGQDVVATSIGARHGRRFYMLMISMTAAAARRHGPGRVLMLRHIEALCSMAIDWLDFGPGGGRHKSDWHSSSLAMSETLLALTPRGIPATMLRRAHSRANTAVRRSPGLIALARWLQGKNPFGRRNRTASPD